MRLYHIFSAGIRSGTVLLWAVGTMQNWDSQYLVWKFTVVSSSNSSFFFLKKNLEDMSFLGPLIPCFGLLVTSLRGFKARDCSLIYTWQRRTSFIKVNLERTAFLIAEYLFIIHGNVDCRFLLFKLFVDFEMSTDLESRNRLIWTEP